MIRTTDPENEAILGWDSFLVDTPPSSNLAGCVCCFCARSHGDYFVVAKSGTDPLGERSERGSVSRQIDQCNFSRI
jgi:hypothetical protein